MQIYIDRLKEGKEQLFDEEVETSLIFEKEDSVSDKPLEVKFKAYLAGKELIIEFQKLKAVCLVPCTVCNETFESSVLLENTRVVLPKDSIKGAVFNPSSLVREQILLEVPAYAECGSGCCPEREELKRFVRKDHGSTT